MACPLCHPPYKVEITRAMLSKRGPSHEKGKSMSGSGYSGGYFQASSFEPGKHVQRQRDAIAHGALSGHGTSPAVSKWDERGPWGSYHGGSDCNVSHKAPREVWPGIFAGGSMKTEWEKPDPRPGHIGVLLDLADVWRKPVITAPGLDGFNAMPTIPRINVRWADFSVPAVSKAEWLMIADHVKTLGGATVACQGGHGRTGTCLAVLGCLLGLIPDAMDPVKAVRKLYCQKAVETSEQVRYIREITGRIVASQGSKA